MMHPLLVNSISLWIVLLFVTYFMLEWLNVGEDLVCFNSRFILIFAVGLILWNLLFQNRKSGINVSDHIDAIHHVAQMLTTDKDISKSKPMIVTITRVDGTIKLIDSALLAFLGYIGLRGPCTIYDIIDNVSVGLCLENGKHEKPFYALARKADGSLIRVSLVVIRVSASLSEIIVIHSQPNVRQMSSLANDSRSSSSKQISVREELNYDAAFVVLLSIVKNRAFSRSSSEEVIAWMGRLHAIIEDQFKQHGLLLIETRCDSFLAIATPCGLPRPASRAVQSASAIARVANAQEQTSIRAGVAFGPATVARLRCPAGGSDVLLLFGDVANVAGRLEQSGDAASVHVCGRTAQSFAEEQGTECPPIEVSRGDVLSPALKCSVVTRNL
jgi:hypothetical protein